jgi:hypothetical protein
MTGNTGLLTQRCDPYGAESKIQLLGGMYDEKYRGTHMWYCREPSVGRFRMVCTGGNYGHRLAADAGLIAATHCDGGHEGQIMPLCRKHVTEYTTGDYAKPRPLRTPAYDQLGREQHWAPGSVVGGSRANNMCPRCMWPPEARELQEVADWLQQEMSRLKVGPMSMIMSGELLRRFTAMEQAQDQVRARFDELYASGRVHKCPLKLKEVS